MLQFFRTITVKKKYSEGGDRTPAFIYLEWGLWRMFDDSCERIREARY